MAKQSRTVAAPDLRATADLVAARRRRRPRLTKEEVVGAALEIVDRDGLAGLTMRELAAQLGVGLATVYTVAGSKEDLLQSLVETVLSEVPVLDSPGIDWDHALVELHCGLHEAFLAHPGIAELAVLQPVTGPAVFAMQERILALLREGGLDQDARTHAYTAITGLLMGFTLLRLSRARATGRFPTSAGFAADQFPEISMMTASLGKGTSTDELRTALLGLARSYARSS